jgi:uncharacterized protein YjiS (DUF1127 family)
LSGRRSILDEGDLAMNSQMTISFPHDYPPRGTSASLGWPFNAAGRLTAWLRCKRQARRSRSALDALDNKMLADLGITRGQIGSVARLGRLPDWGEGHPRRSTQSC